MLCAVKRHRLIFKDGLRGTLNPLALIIKVPVTFLDNRNRDVHASLRAHGGLHGTASGYRSNELGDLTRRVEESFR